MPRTGRPPKPAVDRFVPRMQPVASGCIEWTGRIDRYGYGQFLPEGGRSANNMGAHRWSYEHFVGPIPAGYQIDHLCRNRACVNPAHLEAVTPRENTLRSLNPPALNAKKTHCIRGHEFTPENTDSRNGGRSCRTCRRERDLAYYYATRDEKNAVRNARRREAGRLLREAKEAS